MPIYKQSVNVRRMTAVLWAPPGEYMANYVGTAYCFDVDSVGLRGVYSDTTQLNSTDPVEQSCFCL